MEKVNLLLDETTIINFKLVWKLAGRYRSHLTLAVISFSFLFVYFYFSQPIIYSTTVPIKVVAKHTISSDLSALLPVENTNGITLSELNVSLASFSFSNSFAAVIFEDPDFDKLNFGSIASGHSLTGEKIRANCKNVKTCILDRLVSSLQGFYFIEQGLTENRYSLTVSALNEFSVYKISKGLVKAIEQDRIDLKKYQVIKEIDSVSNLIKESRSILQKMNGFDVLDNNEKDQVDVIDLRERIRILQGNINSEMSIVTTLEARVAESKKSTKSMNNEERLNYINQVAIQKKLSEIRQNIATLSSMPESSRSISDNLILEKLTIELKKIEGTSPEESEVRSSEIGDAFSNAQRGREKDIEFDYYVSKNKLEKLQAEYQDAKKKLDYLTRDKISKDSVVNKLKTDLEFLKNLESKQLSLKLMASTMTSDLFFEEFGKGTREFRRSSILKIFMFSLSINAFVYLFSILIRYLLDDRIYSEEDLKNYFIKLDFIGEVPSFD